VKTENFWMDSTIKYQRVNVGKQGIKEIFSQPFTLSFVKQSTVRQIFQGSRK
jgi:hypothetical protein